jgi:hypothetical protein
MLMFLITSPTGIMRSKESLIPALEGGAGHNVTSSSPELIFTPFN